MAEQAEAPAATGVPSATRYYSQLTTSALVAHSVVLLASSLAIYGTSETTAYALGFVVANLVVVALVWRFGRRALAVAAAWAALNVLFHAPYVWPGLRYPASFVDFGLGIPLLATLVVAAVGGALGFARNRGWGGGPSQVLERRALTAVALGTVAVAVTSAALDATSGRSVSASDRAGTIEVAMRDLRFEPESLRADRDGTRFVVVNRDRTVHTFTIAELGLSVTVLPGDEAIIALPDGAAPGAYTFVCAIAGHDSMRGTLAVE